MLLFHFSEDPGIRRFEPRPSRLEEPLVWAIDAWHAPMYLLPRDCPRVCYFPLPTTNESDLARFRAETAARMVICVEAGWLERLRTTALYRYTLPGETFEPLHDHGLHVSRSALEPLAVDAVPDLLAAHAAADVELRVTPSLWPLAWSLQQTSLHWSLIRMRNALPPLKQ